MGFINRFPPTKRLHHSLGELKGEKKIRKRKKASQILIHFSLISYHISSPNNLSSFREQR